MSPVWLDLQQAADHLGVSLSLLKKEKAAGRLPYRKIGRRVVLNAAELDAWALDKPGVSIEALS